MSDESAVASGLPAAQAGGGGARRRRLGEVPGVLGELGGVVDRREVFGERPLRWQELIHSARLGRSGWHVERGERQRVGPGAACKGMRGHNGDRYEF
jgi:hypothetical protein